MSLYNPYNRLEINREIIIPWDTSNNHKNISTNKEVPGGEKLLALAPSDLVNQGPGPFSDLLQFLAPKHKCLAFMLKSK